MIVLAVTRVGAVLTRSRLGRDVAATKVEARAMAKPVARYVSRRVVLLGDVRAAADFTEGVFAVAHYVERVAGWDVTDAELAEASAGFDDLHPEPNPNDATEGGPRTRAPRTEPGTTRPRRPRGRPRSTTAAPPEPPAGPAAPPGAPLAPIVGVPTAPADVLGQVDGR
jgi:hypothetical protein